MYKTLNGLKTGNYDSVTVGNISLNGSTNSIEGIDIVGVSSLSCDDLTVTNGVSASTLTGTIQTQSQPNITSVGTLGSLSVTNGVSASTLTGTLQTASQPNITSVGTLGSLSVTNGVTASTLTGTIQTQSQPNITSVGTLGSLSVTNGVTASTLTGTIQTPSQPNITSVGTLGSLSVTNGVTASTLTGTIQTPSQPNITSVGTLGTLSISGDLTVNSTTLKVDSSNNRIGFGTSSPSYFVDFVDTTNKALGVVRFNNSVSAGTYASWTTIPGISIFRYSTQNFIRMVCGISDTNIIEFNTTGIQDAKIYSYHSTTASLRHLAFYLNGNVERMRINYLGNLGVGVTDPLYKIHASGDINVDSSGVYRIGGTQVLSSSALSVTGNVSGGSLSITGDVTIDTNTLKVDSSNNRVGIGTASPLYTFDIQTTNNSTGFARFLNSVPASTFITWTAPTGVSIFRMNSENYIRMVSGTTDVNAIEFNTTGLRDAMIYSKHDGTTASNKHIAFYLNGCVERMRINYLGNLGVGVTDPLYKIHSSGDINISSGGVYRIGGTQVLSSSALTVTGNISGATLDVTGITNVGSASSKGAIYLKNIDGSTTYHGIRYAGSTSTFESINPDGIAVFGFGGGVLGSTSSGIEKVALRWDNSGRVGIGSSSAPSYNLDVTGTARFTSSVNVASLTSSGTITGTTLTGTTLDIVGSGRLTSYLNVGSLSSSGAITGTTLSCSSGISGLTLDCSGNITQQSGIASLKTITGTSLSCSSGISGLTLDCSGNITQQSGIASLKTITGTSLSCTSGISGLTLDCSGNITQQSGIASLKTITGTSLSCTSGISGLTLDCSGNITQQSGTASLKAITGTTLSCSATLTVTGNTTLSNASCSGTLGVTGNTTLSSATCSGSLSCASLSVTSSYSLAGSVTSYILSCEDGGQGEMKFYPINSKLAYVTVSYGKSNSNNFGYVVITSNGIAVQSILPTNSIVTIPLHSVRGATNSSAGHYMLCNTNASPLYTQASSGCSASTMYLYHNNSVNQSAGAVTCSFTGNGGLFGSGVIHLA